MKKIKILSLILLFGFGLIKANPVEVNVAQKVAQNFYATIHSGNQAALSLAYTERDGEGIPVYYVFNVNAPAKGFVIVTADDAAHPIIGYSDEGNFVIPQLNNNIDFWMKLRRNEIINMRSKNLPVTSSITNEWNSYTSGTLRTSHNAEAHSVLPLVPCEWNQEPWYNQYCPGGSVTGCVATAMAQIMKYWSYPSVGISYSCYNDVVSQGYTENYGTLCAYYDTSHYIWSEMQNTPLGSFNNQIGKLMYDCGVSVAMDYSPSGSGANVMGGWGPSAFTAFTEYFGYDASTINGAMMNSYTDSNWVHFLEAELDLRRPMQYEGTDPSQGGHSWVCDGYSGLNMFHMNWGWGGANNGYYYANSLTPSGFDFSQYVGVIYGIQPPSAAGVKQVTENTNLSVYPNPSHGVFNMEMPNNNNTYQVKVYNMLGEEISTSTISSGKGEINLSSQAKGVYIYKALSQTGDLISTGRLVVE